MSILQLALAGGNSGDSDNFDDTWWRIQAALRAELGEHRYHMWIAPLKLHAVTEAQVIFKCTTPFFRDNVKERFGDRVSALIELFSGRTRSVDFIADNPVALPRDPQPLFDTSEAAREAIAERRITVDQIKRRAVAWYKLTQGDLESRSRRREVVVPRQIAAYAARRLTGQSFPQIARRFSRDHTTVLHGVQVVAKRMSEDATFAADVEAFMRHVCEENPG